MKERIRFTRMRMRMGGIGIGSRTRKIIRVDRYCFRAFFLAFICRSLSIVLSNPAFALPSLFNCFTEMTQYRILPFRISHGIGEHS